MIWRGGLFVVVCVGMYVEEKSVLLMASLLVSSSSIDISDQNFAVRGTIGMASGVWTVAFPLVSLRVLGQSPIFQGEFG